VHNLFPPYSEPIDAPYNTALYIAIGYSLGGATAAGAMAVEPSTLGGLNLDGLFVDLSDVKKLFLMIADTEHIPEIEPSSSPFSTNESGGMGVRVAMI
jgi:hypothetical protein